MRPHRARSAAAAPSSAASRAPAGARASAAAAFRASPPEVGHQRGHVLAPLRPSGQPWRRTIARSFRCTSSSRPRYPSTASISLLRRPMMRSRVGRAIGRQAVRQRLAARVADQHRIAALEAAADTQHARGQQALACRQRGRRAVVDDDLAARLERTGDPLLAHPRWDVSEAMNQVQRAPVSTACTGWRTRPEAITMWQPAASAMRPAATLVIMPPLPTSVAASPAMASISGVTARTSATSSASGRSAGRRYAGRRYRTTAAGSPR
jgi:hypothetical protein